MTSQKSYQFPGTHWFNGTVGASVHSSSSPHFLLSFSPRVIHMADERLSAACLWNQHLARKIEINARSERGGM